jgi:Domain of unknown function (DUF4136)
METLMSRSLLTLALALAASLSACSSNPVHVRVDKDPARSVSSYSTFGFYDRQSTDSARYETLLTSHLKAATRQQLESRGYVYSEEQPALLVNFLVNVRQEQQIHASAPAGGFYGVRGYRGWGLHGYDIDTVTTKQGALTIDLVDASTQSLIWRGIGEGAITSKTEANSGAAVGATVSAIFRNLPDSPAR